MNLYFNFQAYSWVAHYSISFSGTGAGRAGSDGLVD